MAWTPEHVETVRKLWADGLSASEIARRLGASFTRNMVIGKVTRMKLPGRLDKKRNRFSQAASYQGFVTSGRLPFLKPADGKKRAPAPPVEPTPKETVVANESERVPFEALEAFDRRCRYPHGDAPPYAFCGLPTALGTSWCVSHLKAISPPLKAKIEAAIAEPIENPEHFEQSQKVGELEGAA